MAGWPPAKNTAFTWFFVLRDADGDLIAGATSLDVEFSIDGGAFVNVAGAEVDEGEGLYSCPITAAEMNGDVVSLICKTATAGVKTAAVVIYTSTRQIDDLAFPSVSGRNFIVETDGMIHADLKEWLSVAPLVLVSQRVRTQVELITANVINAASINAAALTAAKFGAGAIDANAIAADAIGSSELAATAVQKIVDGILDELSASHVGAGSVGQVIDNLPNDGSLTNLDVAISTRATPAEVLTNVIQALKDVGIVLLFTTVETVVNTITYVIPAVDASPDDNAYNDCVAIFIDQVNAEQRAVTGVLDYQVGTRRVVIEKTPDFTIVVGDIIAIIPASLSRFIISDQTPYAGSAIGSINTRVNNLDIVQVPGVQSDIDNIQTRLPAALVNARMDSEVQAAGFTQGAADKVWLSASRTLTAISTAVALSIWQVLETAILTAGSIGLKIKTNLDALISSRSSHSAVDVRTEMDSNSVDLNSLLSLITAARMGALDDWLDAGRLDALLDLIKAKTDTLPSGPAKNVALSNFAFLMVLSSDDVTPAPGLTITGEISIDGAAFVALTNVEVEITNGLYRIDLTAAEMNGDVIILKFTAATANQRTIVLLTT